VTVAPAAQAASDLAVPPTTTLDREADHRLVRLVYAFLACATAWLVCGTAVGEYIALKFVWPDLGIASWLSEPRLRPIHTNIVLYGWASLGGISLALLVVPRTSRTSLRHPRFAWTALGLINAAIIVGTICLIAGLNNGAQEYREYLWPVMATLVAGIALLLFALYRTVAMRGTEPIYISNWYILGAFIWVATLLTIAYLPWYQHGLSETVIQGYFMHNAVGMWFTPLVLGMLYYALPKLLNKPIYSYALGVLAFWTQLCFYTMLGAHHFVFSPTPWSLQTVAIVFSIGMIVPVFAGTANFLLTIRGEWSSVADSYALPFIFVGVIMYFVASMQGTLEAFRSLNTVWHFTDFTVAHSHMAMYGFVSFLLWGGMYGLMPPLTGRRPSLRLVGVHFWFALIGLTIYATSLMVGGTLRGISWIHGAPFIDSVVLMVPYWTGRMIGGTLMFLSHLIFAYNVWRMRPMRAAGEEHVRGAV
jgi:cytochrome c oxidase cbb3-type subunit 1